MAIFNAQGAVDDAAIPVVNENIAQLIVANSTTWSFSDGHVAYTYSGTGLTFDDGELDSGVISGWAVAVNGSPVFAVTGGSYASSGPDNPFNVLGYDIWDGGYLSTSGHTVFREQADLAWLLRGADVVNGSAQADHLSGFLGNDQIFGNGGNDVLRGWDGNDTIDGGAGIDISAYYSARTGTIVGATGTGWTVGAVSGIDTLTNVERLVFNDSQGLALDLNGHAGQAAKLIGAVFGAAAVSNEFFVGIALHFLDAGMSYQDLGAAAMSASGAHTNAAVVETLWFNLVGAPIDNANKLLFVGMLDGGLSVGALTAAAADLSFNTANIGLVGLTQTGLAYQYQGTLT